MFRLSILCMGLSLALYDAGPAFRTDLAKYGPLALVSVVRRREGACAAEPDPDLGDSDADLVGLYVSRIAVIGGAY